MHIHAQHPPGFPATPTRRLRRGHAATGAIALCSTLGAALAALALALPAAASATPTVTARAKILPIPGFKHTGNCLGCGASLETEFKISGTEYSGGPPPLIGVNVAFPKGTKITTKGFKTCSPSVILKSGPGACPKKSKAGPVGMAEGFVSLGGERVHENTEIFPLFAPGGGLEFWVEGRTPTKIEILSKGHWTHASSPYGPQLDTEVPLIETLPGAPDGSATRIRVKAGAAYRKGRRTVYYGTVPRSCPKGGFPGRAELFFLGGAKVTVTTKVACPAGKKGRRSSHGRKSSSKHHGHHPKGKAKGHRKSHGKGKHKGHSKGPSTLY
jgi:hypothetical protein